jgi:hypothetical protein
MLSVESPGVVVDSFEIRCRHHRFMSRAQLKLLISETADEFGGRCRVGDRL